VGADSESSAIQPTVQAAKLELAEISFHEVLRHLQHGDEKAARILTAMAFVAAGAAAVMAAQMQSGLDPATFDLGGRTVHVATASFVVFVALLVFGALCTLLALHGGFNVPPEWTAPSRRRVDGALPSLLFSERIVDVSRETWWRHWSEHGPEALKTELATNLVNETYLIAEKAVRKWYWLDNGTALFRLSLAPLVWFLIVAFIPDIGLGVWLATTLTFVGLAVITWDRGLKPTTRRRLVQISLSVACLLGAITSASIAVTAW